MIKTTRITRDEIEVAWEETTEGDRYVLVGTYRRKDAEDVEANQLLCVVHVMKDAGIGRAVRLEMAEHRLKTDLSDISRDPGFDEHPEEEFVLIARHRLGLTPLEDA